ncbi:MAG: alcohol dehydrogenase catalytic domain-containing protein [Candidatus Lokiarchaeota archaeon]|nr:alcohol dehydrogenase catalytic domain-containing protein [Candidatus Lokiarchaeota archaeon]
MKAAVFKGKESVVIEEGFEKPIIEPDEVLIRVKKVGICGSDVGSYESGGPYLPEKVIGHEFSGDIVEIGEKVKKIKLGMRVTVNPQIPCYECYYCLHDLENMCKLQNYSYGTTEHGAMREFFNVKAERIHILPDNVSYEEGATVEPLSVAVYAVEQSGFQLGQSAAVIGAGPIGLMIIQVLRAAGASKIYVLEPVESKQKIALDLGADKVFLPKNWNKIGRLTEKLGPNHVYDCVGLSETFSSALKLVRKGGKITLIGMHASTFELNSILLMTTNNISVRGVYGYNHDIFKTAINLFDQKKIKIDSLITSRIKLDQVPEMFKILGNPPHDELKVIVEFD